MWASALSLGSSTEAIPPWAQALALSSGALGDEGDFEFVGKAQGEGLAGKTTAQDQYIESDHLGIPRGGRYGGADYSTGAGSCRNRQNPSGD